MYFLCLSSSRFFVYLVPGFFANLVPGSWSPSSVQAWVLEKDLKSNKILAGYCDNFCATVSLVYHIGWSPLQIVGFVAALVNSFLLS